MLLAETPAAPRPGRSCRSGPRRRRASVLAHELRRAGIAVDLPQGQARAAHERADRIGAKWAVSLGSDELAQGVVQLRDLDSGVQEELGLDALAAKLVA